MQTSIAPALADDPRVTEVEQILRKCVHCGFCLATCPTYNLLGDELDSPRGRIYMIKQVVEGQEPTASTMTHLDRCLTCRNCETTCPSGVEYGHLVDHGRALVEERVSRPLFQRLLRKLIMQSLPYRRRMRPFVALGQSVRGLMPAGLKASVPPKQQRGVWPDGDHQRTMLVLEGCVQPSMTPATNHATARVLDAIGIRLLPIAQAGCCGAIHYHLNEQEAARDFIRRNIDAWWPQIEAGAEAIVTTASGCGVMVKDYGEVLKNDPDYADKAARVSELCVDIVEVLVAGRICRCSAIVQVPWGASRFIRRARCSMGRSCRWSPKPCCASWASSSHRFRMPTSAAALPAPTRSSSRRSAISFATTRCAPYSMASPT